MDFLANSKQHLRKVSWAFQFFLWKTVFLPIWELLVFINYRFEIWLQLFLHADPASKSSSTVGYVWNGSTFLWQFARSFRWFNQGNRTGIIEKNAKTLLYRYNIDNPVPIGPETLLVQRLPNYRCCTCSSNGNRKWDTEQNWILTSAEGIYYN